MQVYKRLSLLLLFLPVLVNAANLPQKCISGSLDIPDYTVNPITDFKAAEFYLAEIAELKKEGIYNPDLVPVLLELGMLQQHNNEHKAATKSLEDVALVMKVNKGLYFAERLSIIDLLIKSHIELTNWETVTNLYDQKYWLINRNYPDNNPAILPVIKEVRQWHRDAYNKETGRSLEQHFRVSEKIYDQGIEVIKACGGTTQQAQCFWHRACCHDAPPEYGICPLDGGQYQ